LTSRLAQLHFAPTERARENLLREQIPPENVFVTGNTVVDALLLAVERVRNNPPEIPELPNEWRERWSDSRVVLITGHRRENFGAGFESICRAIAALAEQFPDTHFVYPVHLNPNVRKPVEQILRHRRESMSNIHLIEPLSYLPFVALMDRSDLILTDSGGIQEEAPSLGKPVLVMRDTTERPEGIEAGTAKLVGTNFDSIVRETGRLLSDEVVYKAMSHKHNPFGDGHATRRILKACASFLRVGA
jgi:UDP-N-acetylglucosamine 2-epimerase (non-hydrolysing)